LLYTLLKIPAKIALPFYCRNIIINNKELLESEGPLLIAANHPNSFLDAIILATLFNNPIYSLARGDAFVNNFFRRLLYSLKMLPVYRISEGVENLEHNYTTFSACIDIFKNNGIVLMFSEGRCVNEWHLRPLKKGTARLAISTWEQGIPLKVLPLGINYSSFRKFGKNIILNFGEAIEKEKFSGAVAAGEAINIFNEKLKKQLEKLVIEIKSDDSSTIKKTFFVPQSVIKKILLFIPAIVGLIFHAPLYYTIVFSIKKKAHDHFDSIVYGLLFILYPIYLSAIIISAYFITGIFWVFFFFLILPFTAWSYLQIKSQV